jgi:hypothetical protein
MLSRQFTYTLISLASLPARPCLLSTPSTTFAISIFRKQDSTLSTMELHRFLPVRMPAVHALHRLLDVSLTCRGMFVPCFVLVCSS